MNIIFFTQTSSLKVFYQLYLRLKDSMPIKRVAFYVAGIHSYEEFLSEHVDFEDRFIVLKEWELYKEATGRVPDLISLKAFEREIGDPTLWGPILTDRRTSHGKYSGFRQKYDSGRSHGELQSLLEVSIRRIDGLFQEVKPDAVCTLYTATLGDHIAHLMAKARGAVSLDLRLARLKNYVMFADGIVDPPTHIVENHQSFEGEIPEELMAEAEQYISSVIEKNSMYEGVLPAAPVKSKEPDSEPPQKSSLPVRVLQFGSKFLQQFRDPYRYDPQHSGYFKPLLYTKLYKPFNVARINRALKKQFVSAKDLEGLDYVLYPLHTEPELVLAQFARPYLNQIEVIRNISTSIPMGMTLLVKEHPLMRGRRSLQYYKKLLTIPNVKLVEPALPSEDVLRSAKLVVIIRGAIGLEAVLKRLPVVSLGKSLFDMLPDSMYCKCNDLFELPDKIKYMLENYRYEHHEVLRYLAAVIKGAAGVNLITDLLGKKGRFRTSIDGEQESYEKHPHLDVLADYMAQRLQAISLKSAGRS